MVHQKRDWWKNHGQMINFSPFFVYLFILSARFSTTWYMISARFILYTSSFIHNVYISNSCGFDMWLAKGILISRTMGQQREKFLVTKLVPLEISRPYIKDKHPLCYKRLTNIRVGYVSVDDFSFRCFFIWLGSMNCKQKYYRVVLVYLFDDKTTVKYASKMKR